MGRQQEFRMYEFPQYRPDYVTVQKWRDFCKSLKLKENMNDTKGHISCISVTETVVTGGFGG